MATETRPAVQTEPIQLPRESAVRWWVVPLVAFGVLVLLLVLAAAVVAWKWRADNLAALARVKVEVARIEASGLPITTQGLYAYHRVPEGTLDSTTLWLAALNSFDERQFNADGTNLPIVGTLEGSALAPPGDPALLAACEAFLKKYDPTREAILAAARHGGECRIPVKFEDGIGMLVPNAQKVRCLYRLLALDIRARTCRGDTAGALESLEAIYATTVTMEAQLTLVEQLVGVSVASAAFKETEQLLSELEFSDEQLARLEARLAALDIQAGLTTGLIGERAMGYHTFHHLDQVPDVPQLKAMGRSGQLSRPADCEWYLQLFDEMIAASKEPFPEARNRARAVENQLKARVGTKNPLEKVKYMVTMLILPATGGAFDASARTIAHRDALRMAVAAERYRLATGALPAQATDLVPKYLPAIPRDPFDGLPLRLKPGTDSSDLFFYSVGRDGLDNGGLETSPNEPDIAVRLRAKKGGP